jgi:DNA-binding NarL/FixJ family response regulator
MIWELVLTGALSSTVTASAGAFFYRKIVREAAALEKRLGEQELATADIKPLEAQVASLEQQMAEYRQQQKERADWVSDAESLNLTHRGQVLRLYRRGDSVEDIASTLRMGQGEVRLMTKIYEFAQESSTRANEQK